MAHAQQANTNVFNAAFDAVTHALASVAKSVGAFFVLVAEKNSRKDAIDRLNNLTDVELATKYGINRDGIVAYVYRDRMF